MVLFLERDSIYTPRDDGIDSLCFMMKATSISTLSSTDSCYCLHFEYSIIGSVDDLENGTSFIMLSRTRSDLLVWMMTNLVGLLMNV